MVYSIWIRKSLVNRAVVLYVAPCIKWGISDDLVNYFWEGYDWLHKIFYCLIGKSIKSYVSWDIFTSQLNLESGQKSILSNFDMPRPRLVPSAFFLDSPDTKVWKLFLGVIRCIDFEKNIENIWKNLGHVISPFLVEKWSKFRFKPPYRGVPLYLWLRRLFLG